MSDLQHSLNSTEAAKPPLRIGSADAELQGQSLNIFAICYYRQL